MMLVYMLESKIVRQISAKLSPKTTSSTIVETLFCHGQFFKRLSSITSEQDFNQNVGEVAYSIYLAVY